MEDVLDKSVSLILLRFFVSGALIHGYLRRTQHEYDTKDYSVLDQSDGPMNWLK